MKKKKNKLGTAAHIKKQTVGTSNEISFSVLDAAKNELDSEKNKDTSVRPTRPGFISLFTLPLRRKKNIATPTKEQGLPLSSGEFASGGESPKRPTSPSTETLIPKKDGEFQADAPKKPQPKKNAPAQVVAPPSPTLSPEEEILRRKTRRRRQRFAAATLSIILGLGIIGAGTWYLFQEQEKHLNQVDQLFSALDLIKEADTTILEMDSIVVNPHDSGSVSSIPEALEHLPQARENLDKANQIAREVLVDLRESKDKEAANQAVIAVNARKALLDSGETLLLEAQQSDALAKRLQAAWQEVVRADSLARDAAALIVDTTDENAQASIAKSEEAKEAFLTAQTEIDKVALEHPNIDLVLQKEYVEKRFIAMEYAIAADKAFLEKNKEEATLQNDAYNTTDAEAVAIAADLPVDITELVYDAFVHATEETSEIYSTARLQAGSADAFLSDYLGTTSK